MRKLVNSLVLINGKIYVKRGVFAESVYIENGVIRAVGSNSDIAKLAGNGAKVIDCEGRTVIPGLNDSHLHMFGLGANMMRLQLSGVSCIEEIIKRARDFLAAHPGETALRGRNWNEDLFTSGEHRAPTRYELDKISTEIPIVLHRVCGHVASVNTKVINMMGLTGDSPQFPDGTFQIGPDGTPNGVLTEEAITRATELLPEIGQSEHEAMYAAAANRALSFGVTSVQSNDAGPATLPVERSYKVVSNVHARQFTPRYRGQLSFKDVQEFRDYLSSDFRASLNSKSNNSHVTLGPLKLFKDGSLGGRTALMHKPYRDDPASVGNTGVEVLSVQAMDEYCTVARDAGVQVITHAIGDKAIADTLASYIKADLTDGASSAEGNAKNKLRNVINHCQITDCDMLESIAQNNICVAYQPIFLDYDMHITESRVGRELASSSYAFGTLAKLGVHIGYSTDAPIEDCNPFANIYSAVTRMDKNFRPECGWFPNERVDIETALDAYTIGSAYLEFHECDKGRIQENFMADMVMLDRDIFTCDPKGIREILPVMTILNGEIVYQR